MPNANAEKYNAAASGALLNRVIGELSLKNDAALSRALQVAPPVISKLRYGRLPFGDTLIVRVHEVTDWPIRAIKKELGQASLPIFRQGNS